MKKVLFITLRSDIGGAPKHFLDLLSNLKDEVNVYVASPLDLPYGEKFKSIAHKHIPLKHRSFSIFTLIKLFIFVLQNKIDIIHSHGRGAGVYSRPLILSGAKIVHTFHGIHLESKIKILVDKLLKPFTHRFILISQAELSEAISRKVAIPRKSVIINNGLNLNKNHLNFKKNYAIKKSDFKVGSLVRFDYQKGLDIMVQTIVKHRSVLTAHNIHFYIAGNGSEFTKTKRAIEKYNLEKFVHLVGSTNKPFAFLQSLDLYISFSRWEAGVPYSVMEAMYSECPVLLSDTVGNNELKIENDKTLFSLNDPDDFLKKLLVFYNQPKLREGVSKKLKQEVIYRFSAQHTAKKTLKEYNLL